MSQIIVLIAICITLIPGINFFVKVYMHKKALAKSGELSAELDKWSSNGDVEKLKEVIAEQASVGNKIFRYHDSMELSNYLLAAGACSFAIIEFYKLIIQWFRA